MIGIIGAMDIEVNALKKMMTDAQSRVIGGIEYTSGVLCGKNVVAAVCGIGKVNAAVCSQTMIMSYDLSCIINTGVAGSLTIELGVGDIAVARDAVEHDIDTTPLGEPRGYIDGINMVKIPADDVLARKLCDAAETLGIKFRLGTIASGDTFVNRISQKAQIVNNFGAIACEMEGAAIAHVCCLNKLPFGIIRAISDNAIGKSEVEYPKFKLRAAEMSNKMIIELLKNL